MSTATQHLPTTEAPITPAPQPTIHTLRAALSARFKGVWTVKRDRTWMRDRRARWEAEITVAGGYTVRLWVDDQLGTCLILIDGLERGIFDTWATTLDDGLTQAQAFLRNEAAQILVAML